MKSLKIVLKELRKEMITLATLQTGIRVNYWVCQLKRDVLKNSLLMTIVKSITLLMEFMNTNILSDFVNLLDGNPRN